MAAILIPTPEPRPLRRSAPAPRPHLTVIEGGRSDRHLAATYRRRRVAAVAVALVLAVTALAGARAALALVTPHTAAATTAAVGGHSVVVRPGDSFWSIARRIQPTGDVRPLVDRLSAAHGPAPLQPGDVLSVGH